MDITAEIVTAFRTAYPEFADLTAWPNTTVTTALCEGDAETGGACWGGYDATDCHNFKARGMYLYAAHWLRVSYPTAAGATTPGSKSGTAQLSVASKSVGDESIAFNTGNLSTLTVGDSWLAATQYGQQWMRLRRRAGRAARAV